MSFSSPIRPLAVPIVIASIGASLSCDGPAATSTDAPAASSDGLILQSGEGELVMGYEDIAPGAEIHLHRHVVADEILSVHRGSGTASLNGRKVRVSAGATIYTPRNATIGLVNDGSETLGITFTFSRPGFEDLMRDNSVPEGEPVTPLSADERARIQAKHRWHTIAGAPRQ